MKTEQVAEEYFKHHNRDCIYNIFIDVTPVVHNGKVLIDNHISLPLFSFSLGKYSKKIEFFPSSKEHEEAIALVKQWFNGDIIEKDLIHTFICRWGLYPKGHRTAKRKWISEGE